MKKRIPPNDTVVRAGKNAHRFFCFANGKLNTQHTFKEDIQSAVADLCGLISNGNLIKPSLILLLPGTGNAYALAQDSQSVADNVQFLQNGNTLNISATAARSIIGNNEKMSSAVSDNWQGLSECSPRSLGSPVISSIVPN